METSSSAPSPRFLLTTCQVGAESALKHELARRGDTFRFAYSRPGFVTFKLSEAVDWADDYPLRAVFARAHAFSLGRVAGATEADRVAAVAKALGETEYRRLHVWSRDREPPGHHDFEPGPSPEAAAVRTAVLAALPPATAQALADATARVGERVLDLILVGPDEWWLGQHRAHDIVSCQPGGLFALELPYAAVSRAWLKMEEALRWAELPMRPGERCVELGCAPGGSCQALLERGLVVTGVDPAEMHPAVLAHPNFTHLRKRGADVRRSVFRGVRWLTADMNVAPRYTLDTVEAIATHPVVQLAGMLLTLKLTDWRLADELPTLLARIRGWGFPRVRARQLQYNRQEVCVLARTIASRRGGRRPRPIQRGRRG